MSGTRQYKSPEPTTVKLSLAVPVDLDRQLRARAVRERIPVAAMVREWITEKLNPVPQGGRRSSRQISITG